MAKVIEINKKQWNDWVKTRPKVIQKLCERFPPDKLYQILGHGHRATIYSYEEDGTMTVNVTGEYNLVVCDRQVFGVKPSDIKECDLPNC